MAKTLHWGFGNLRALGCDLSAQRDRAPAEVWSVVVTMVWVVKERVIVFIYTLFDNRKYSDS